jgi:hypothetical protein
MPRWIGTWSMNNKNKHHKDICLKVIQILLAYSHSMVNSNGRTYAFNKSIDGSLSIIISKWGEVWISIWFHWWFVVDLLMRHNFCRAIVNWNKLENIKCEPKNTLYLIRWFIAPTNKGERESDENYCDADTYWWALLVDGSHKYGALFRLFNQQLDIT